MHVFTGLSNYGSRGFVTQLSKRGTPFNAFVSQELILGLGNGSSALPGHLVTNFNGTKVCLSAGSTGDVYGNGYGCGFWGSRDGNGESES